MSKVLKMTRKWGGRFAAFFVVSCVMPWSLSAAECVWTGASGAWGNSAGWQNGTKPSSAGDTVVILGVESGEFPSYAFDGVGDYANISRWHVTFNGKSTRWSSKPSSDGSGFRIVPKGLSILIR